MLDDTFKEVDVYLAYGLYGQAEKLLAKAIEQNPNNSKLADMLLETQTKRSQNIKWNSHKMPKLQYYYLRVSQRASLEHQG